MTPTHTHKGVVKYRYYISLPLVQGQSEQAGSISRVPAGEIEPLVTKSVRDHLGLPADLDDRALVETHVMRVDLQSDRLIIELAEMRGANGKRRQSARRLAVPWRKTSGARRREILLPEPPPLIPCARSGPRTAPSSLLQLPKDDAG